ncbi:hypothetical protein GQ44DRAFT_732729 [Phaeosphaeriaceae sp. PMI808]|nr:hypothetical protein GQ44DRAFT_732729 [Phaeosphaeriaceae sp. PMI808]
MLFAPISQQVYQPLLHTFQPSVHPATRDERPQGAQPDSHYHKENDIACCTQSATVTPPNGTPLVMFDRTFSGGQFVTSTAFSGAMSSASSSIIAGTTPQSATPSTRSYLSSSAGTPSMTGSFTGTSSSTRGLTSVSSPISSAAARRPFGDTSYVLGLQALMVLVAGTFPATV